MGGDMDSWKKLSEPLDSFRNEFQGAFRERAEELFEGLVQASGIDIESNRKVMAEVAQTQSVIDELQSDVHKKTILSYVLKALFVIGALYGASGVWTFYHTVKYSLADTDGGFVLWRLLAPFWDHIGYVSFVILVIAVLFFSFSYIFKSLPSEIREKKDEIAHLDGVNEKRKAPCKEEMKRLTGLLDPEIPNRIIREVMPGLDLDPLFDWQRYMDLTKNFGLSPQMGERNSSLDLISGTILGNPFLIYKTLQNRVAMERYTGSIVVSYEVVEYDTNGKRSTRTVNETLSAYVDKPKEVFERYTSLVFGSDAVDGLNFSREPHHVQDLSESKLEKYIAKRTKELEKLSHKSTTGQGHFTAMNNKVFEALFDAVDRDNENQFRMMFTAAAQVNMVKLLKDKQFGDTFSFIKRKKLNIVVNRDDWMIHAKMSHFDNASYDIIRSEYMQYVVTYFEKFYHLFLPILSIPALVNYPSDAYIYGDEPAFNFNPFVSEVMANEIGKEFFDHEASMTPSILKTTSLAKEGDTDRVLVESRSYTIVDRTDYIPKTAGNGRTYDVPVHWKEYIPVSNRKQIEMERVGIDETEFAKRYKEALGKNDQLFEESYAYKSGVLAKIIDDGGRSCSEFMNEILGGNRG